MRKTRLQALQEMEIELGGLPLSPELIVAIEEMGHAVDLETGHVALFAEMRKAGCAVPLPLSVAMGIYNLLIALENDMRRDKGQDHLKAALEKLTAAARNAAHVLRTAARNEENPENRDVYTDVAAQLEAAIEKAEEGTP